MQPSFQTIPHPTPDIAASPAHMIPTQIRQIRTPAIREVSGITIDNKNSMHLDDAIWATKTDKTFTLYVSVANAAHYIFPNSELDIQAARRKATAYSPGGHKPSNTPLTMLPPDLVTKTISLNAKGKRKRVLTAEITYDLPDYTINKIEVYEAVLDHKGQYTYEDINWILEKHAEPLTSIFEFAIHKAKSTYWNRYRAHSPNLAAISELDESAILSKTVINKSLDEHCRARLLVNQSMVAANAAFAIWANEKQIPVIYRVQPDITKKSYPNGTPADLIKAAHTPLDRGITRHYGKGATTAKAHLTTQMAGHSSIRAAAYGWFTSPIRRYIDLVNQRNIVRWLRTGSPAHTRKELDDIASKWNRVLEGVGTRPQYVCNRRYTAPARQTATLADFQYMAYLFSKDPGWSTPPDWAEPYLRLLLTRRMITQTTYRNIIGATNPMLDPLKDICRDFYNQNPEEIEHIFNTMSGLTHIASAISITQHGHLYRAVASVISIQPRAKEPDYIIHSENIYGASIDQAEIRAKKWASETIGMNASSPLPWAWTSDASCALTANQKLIAAAPGLLARHAAGRHPKQTLSDLSGIIGGNSLKIVINKKPSKKSSEYKTTAQINIPNIETVISAIGSGKTAKEAEVKAAANLVGKIRDLIT